MCGIAGWIGKSIPSKNLLTDYSNIVSGVVKNQNHRGPDASGIWADDNHPVILGHNRLSIIDLSSLGSQPMEDVSGRYVISYNGELYNYKALKKDLEEKFNVEFRGSSDTEVFLNGVIFFGIDEFLRLADGMFAAVIYDKSKGEVFLLRDRVGEKPLYYVKNSDNLFFASELRALASATSTPLQMDGDGLKLFLQLRYVPAPLTILSGFKKLQAGHYIRLKIGDDDIVQTPYFSWDPHASEVPVNKKNYAGVVNRTINLLVQSLEKRLMSDVPIGYFLSGGVDSTLCAALIKKFLNKEINTYTIAFEGDSSSEHSISEKTASIIGSNHSTKLLKTSDLEEISLKLIEKMDEPNGDRSCVPTYLLCEHARTEVTVALGGDGGDELFSGYARYANLNNRLREEEFFNAASRLEAYFSTGLPVFSHKLINSLDFDGKGFYEYNHSLATMVYPPVNFETAIRFVDFKSYLPGAVLSKVDRMSMQHSLEVRTPFFSPGLLDLASQLPHEFLYRGVEMKPVLRDICRGIGLGHVADLPKKGFGMPPQFLSQNKIQLAQRASRALSILDKSDICKKTIPDLGKKISSYAGQNMNSLWATIVLGEWVQSMEKDYVD